MITYYSSKETLSKTRSSFLPSPYCKSAHYIALGNIRNCNGVIYKQLTRQLPTLAYYVSGKNKSVPKVSITFYMCKCVQNCVFCFEIFSNKKLKRYSSSKETLFKKKSFFPILFTENQVTILHLTVSGPAISAI